ncbi:hypothetical protein [Pelagicoccus sp. SDUM812002]|uniref:hypothetical protein n=1 Tax=Pelagicoccus sp. SDUM812002 TaxID=3041266 RepID=UPI00280EA748|nr:hypothetical protein [Pelagicoccus sp. SDUM812002]MDQ8184337.1 hypothetical protein [Pelagicoccus sp. SDUM812002]
MKLKILVPTLAIILTSSLFAGSQYWSNSANWNNAESGTDYFYTTASTQFTAQIYGGGDIGGTARAFEGSGPIHAYVEGIYSGEYIMDNDSGTAPAGRTVIIYRSIGVYTIGSYGTARVIASW